MSQLLPDRSGPLRIGDAERDEAVTLLSDHFVAGRLTQDEFEERSEQATRARYVDDLVPLFADLPDASRPQPTRVPARPGPPPAFLFLMPLLMIGLISAVALSAPWMLWALFWIALFSRLFHHGHRHHPPRWAYDGNAAWGSPGPARRRNRRGRPGGWSGGPRGGRPGR